MYSVKRQPNIIPQTLSAAERMVSKFVLHVQLFPLRTFHGHHHYPEITNKHL